jgi:hypothetical protein
LPARAGEAVLAHEPTRRKVERAVIDLISEPRESPLVKRAPLG